MIGFKDTLTELKTALRVISVMNLNGEFDTMLVAMFNNQPEREKDGSGFSYKKPAIFIEPIFSEGIPIGGNASSYEVKFKLLLQIEHFNTEGEMDDDLGILDLKDKVHRNLNGLKLPNCSPLFQSSKTIDTNHGNQYLGVLEYSTCFIDLTGTAHDVDNGNYIIETLVNPNLTIDEIVVTEILNVLLTEDNQQILTEDNQNLLYE